METVSELDETGLDIKQREVLQGSLGKRLQVLQLFTVLNRHKHFCSCGEQYCSSLDCEMLET